MTKRVIITDHEFPYLADEERIARESGADLEIHVDVTEAASVAEIVDGADVVLLAYAEMTEQVLAQLNPGATVVRYGMGYDTIDVEAATRLGVRVCNVPDYGADTVADHTIALALAAVRRLADYHAETVKDPTGWIAAPEIGIIPAISDLNYGLVGTGQIGRKVASRIQAFGATVIAYDPYVEPEKLASEGIEVVSLDELFERADAISIHAPLTPETTHIVGAEAIAKLKDSAIIVNTARGPLLDTRAAAEAVSAGQLGALALDVFEGEPLEEGHPLREAPRTILTPHAAYYSTRSLANLQLYAAEEMGRALREEPLRAQVNRRRG
ncbi:MAG: C-terminal binding protein [Brachybacterium sp.]